MSETFDEAVARLRRETRLSQQIDELQRAVASELSVYLLSHAQFRLIVDQLRELRARRVAAGREPDDEVNAPADMCCCNTCLQGAPARQFRGGCPLHPAPHLQPGWLDGPGTVHGVSEERQLAALARPLLNCDSTPAEAECRYLGGGECEPVTCPVATEAPECTGLTARWCPVHGDCTCVVEPWNEHDLNEPDCPLHGTASDHAEAPPDPEAIARRLLGELGPELAAAVCVQLLGRLPRREP